MGFIEEFEKKFGFTSSDGNNFFGKFGNIFSGDVVLQESFRQKFD
jgi:hypothetical protein